VIELHTSVGAAGLLSRTKLTCSFVTPVVQFSEEAVSFRVEMVRTHISVSKINLVSVNEYITVRTHA